MHASHHKCFIIRFIDVNNVRGGADGSRYYNSVDSVKLSRSVLGVIQRWLTPTVSVFTPRDYISPIRLRGNNYKSSVVKGKLSLAPPWLLSPECRRYNGLRATAVLKATRVALRDPNSCIRRQGRLEATITAVTQWPDCHLKRAWSANNGQGGCDGPIWMLMTFLALFPSPPKKRVNRVWWSVSTLSLVLCRP